MEQDIKNNRTETATSASISTKTFNLGSRHHVTLSLEKGSHRSASGYNYKSGQSEAGAAKYVAVRARSEVRFSLKLQRTVA